MSFNQPFEMDDLSLWGITEQNWMTLNQPYDFIPPFGLPYVPMIGFDPLPLPPPLPVPIGYIKPESPLFKPLVSPPPPPSIERISTTNEKMEMAPLQLTKLTLHQLQCLDRESSSLTSTSSSYSTENKQSIKDGRNSDRNDISAILLSANEISISADNNSDNTIDNNIAIESTAEETKETNDNDRDTTFATTMSQRYCDAYTDDYFSLCHKMDTKLDYAWFCPNHGCKWSINTKGFSDLAALKRHYRRHTEFAFKCDICHSTFARVSNLKDHKKIHSGEKPFVCEYPNCGARYQQRHSLNNHILKHKNIKPFQCHRCGKQYTANHNLQLHLTKNHS